MKQVQMKKKMPYNAKIIHQPSVAHYAAVHL